MKVTLKLFASLGQYLPEGAHRNAAVVDVPGNTHLQVLLDAYNLPPKSCHLVLVNGIYHAPEARAGTALSEGDEVAVWPPVAGG